MNFVVDSLATERALWSLSAVENHARECLSMGVDGGLSSRSFLAWRERRLIRIQSGRPIQNGRVESFNGRLRDECLNANWCPIMSEAKRKLEAWRADFAHDAHAMWLQWRQMNTALTRYDPFQDVMDFPSGFRTFADSVNRMLSEPRSGRPWTPAVDIFETDNELVIKADLPEVDMKDIQIEIENGTLTLKGERKFEAREQGAGYHRIERSYGSFARHFSLPDTVEADKVKADYKNGALTVTLLKKEIARPRTVKVEVHQ